MRVGDIVSVHDGSWSVLCVDVNNGNHASGRELSSREWVVKMIGGPFPTNRHHWSKDVPDNDIMLSERNAPEHILFTQQQFCGVVSEGRREKEIEVPAGTKRIVITLE